MITLSSDGTTAGNPAAARPDSPPDSAPNSAPNLRALTLTGAGLLALGVGLGPYMMFDSRPYSELSATPQHLVHYAVWAACLVALSQIYPRLAGLTGPHGRSVSVAAATAAGVGAALDACARFMLAFVNPFLAAHEPALLDSAPDAILLVPTLGVGVAAMVGVIWLGVSGWRAQVFPRPAVVLLVVGSLAIPVMGPLSNAFVGAALMWCGIAASRRR